MTNPRTPAEKNKAIALLKGWTTVFSPGLAEQGFTGPDAFIWYPPGHHDDFSYRCIYPPNYLGEWEHAGPLLSEMVAARYWAINITSPVADEDWLVYAEEEGVILSDISGRGATLTEAIGSAWLAWKEGKHER